jgi:hypothetical protein
MRIAAFFPLAVLATAACDHTTPTGGVVGTPPIRVGGNWSYSFVVTDGMMASCQAQGSFSVTQSQMGTGDQFNGLVQGVQNCLFGGETTEDALYGGVSLGEIAGESVRFTGLGCLHTGTASGNPATAMSGVATCSFSVPPETPARTFSGSWQASR